MILALFSLAALWIAIDSYRFGISPMPSSKKARKIIASKVEGSLVYELGSGWGNLAFHLAKEREVFAFEGSYIPWLYSLCYSLGRAQLKIFRKDFFGENFSRADTIVCYLYPGAMTKLRKKFEKELEKGTLILSNTFQIPGWKPIEVIETRDFFRSKIYVYRV